MKRYEREIVIERAPDAVFDFFADMTRLPHWAPEDFVSVVRTGDGALGLGSEFEFVTKGASARSTFALLRADQN